jgi:beta-glucosidase
LKLTWRNNMDNKIEDLVQKMTLDEKISLLAGRDMWHTVPIERLGVPAIRVTDGPNGVRGSSGNSSPTSACFPCGSALAATWNTHLIECIGEALADEVKAKAGHILLAPTVNIHRSPIAGRNFECYSEDPYLSGHMASAYIQGLQKKGVGACIKHFVCNDQEFERTTISAEVKERPLREIYLEPFRIAIKEAKPWAVMSAYNRVNGISANANDYILRDILKEEWGFDGVVISDWYGTYDTTSAQGSLDIEMPGPARWASAEHVKSALAEGRLSEADIDDKVRRILRTINRAGAFANPEFVPETADDKPEHRALIRETGGEAVVLLKNDGVLPLQPSKIKKLLVVGENALLPQIVGGGSAHVNSHYVVSPLQGILQYIEDVTEVNYPIGCLTHRSLPSADPSWFRTDEGEQGLKMSVFASLDLSGEPAVEHTIKRSSLNWFGTEQPAPGLDQFSLRLQGNFVPPESGEYTTGIHCIGQGRVLVDGKEVLPFREYRDPAEWSEAQIPLICEKGVGQNLTIEYILKDDPHWRTVRLVLFPPIPEDPIAAAEALAREADAVVIVAGLTNEWESEGHDRVDMRLPGDQDLLISRITAVNPNTVVVLNAGSPLEMPWLSEAAALLQTWYLGQEAGNAIADVLFGVVNPSGKLPTTFPKRLEDNPSFINFPGENGEVLYGEGIYVGYRYYDKKNIEPLFPFGYGLSYTSFDYSDLTISNSTLIDNDSMEISLVVKNTGPAAGKEIVQLYVRDLESRLPRPDKELKAFKKIALQPGESQKVTFNLDTQALTYYDPTIPGWVAEPGEFELLIGASSRDIRLSTVCTLQGMEEHS